jgi:hypothetical protein
MQYFCGRHAQWYQCCFLIFILEALQVFDTAPIPQTGVAWIKLDLINFSCYVKANLILTSELKFPTGCNFLKHLSDSFSTHCMYLTISVYCVFPVSYSGRNTENESSP